MSFVIPIHILLTWYVAIKYFRKHLHFVNKTSVLPNQLSKSWDVAWLRNDFLWQAEFLSTNPVIHTWMYLARKLSSLLDIQFAEVQWTGVRQDSLKNRQAFTWANIDAHMPIVLKYYKKYVLTETISDRFHVVVCNCIYSACHRKTL